jgi:hypothetical protein
MLPRGSVSMRGCTRTSTLAQGPRAETATHSWRSVFPWDTDGQRTTLFHGLAKVEDGLNDGPYTCAEAPPRDHGRGCRPGAARPERKIMIAGIYAIDRPNTRA